MKKDSHGGKNTLSKVSSDMRVILVYSVLTSTSMVLITFKSTCAFKASRIIKEAQKGFLLLQCL